MNRIPGARRRTARGSPRCIPRWVVGPAPGRRATATGIVEDGAGEGRIDLLVESQRNADRRGYRRGAFCWIGGRHRRVCRGRTGTQRQKGPRGHAYQQQAHDRVHVVGLPFRSVAFALLYYVVNT